MAIEAGVSPRSLIADPGIAFAKSHDEDLEVLRRLGEFRSLGLPLLVAASRKHFIGSVTGLPPDRARRSDGRRHRAQHRARRRHRPRARRPHDRARSPHRRCHLRGRAGDYAATPERGRGHPARSHGTRIGESIPSPSRGGAE